MFIYPVIIHVLPNESASTGFVRVNERLSVGVTTRNAASNLVRVKLRTKLGAAFRVGGHQLTGVLARVQNLY